MSDINNTKNIVYNHIIAYMLVYLSIYIYKGIHNCAIYSTAADRIVVRLYT